MAAVVVVVFAAKDIMSDLKSVAQWINVLAQNDKRTLSLRPFPPAFQSLIDEDICVDVASGRDVASATYDVIIAFDFGPEDLSTGNQLLTWILDSLVRHGVLLITAGFQDSLQIKDSLEVYFRNVSGIKLHSTTELSELQHQCWLIEKTAQEIEQPVKSMHWARPLGDLFHDGLNGDKSALDHLYRYGFQDKNHVRDFKQALFQLEYVARFQCTGWTEIKCNDTSVYLLSGEVVDRHAEGEFVRGNAGAALSWEEAAFYMICEGVERTAQRRIAKPGLSGIAYGFCYDSADRRARLECLERHFFNLSFLDAGPIYHVDEKALTALSRRIGDLWWLTEQPHVFILTDQAPFFTVLALRENGEDAPTFGLGCHFDLERAVEKALIEVVQTTLYGRRQKDAESEARRMSPQAKHLEKVWASLDHQSYRDQLKARAQPFEGGSFAVVDDKAQDCVLGEWCVHNGIEFHSETLLKLSLAGEGYVVRSRLSDRENVLYPKTIDSLSLPFPMEL